MIAKSRTEKIVVLRGSVREIDKGTKSFQLQPIYGNNVQVIASNRIFDDLDHVLNEGSDHARILVKGIGVYREDELEYLMQVDDISPLNPLDVTAQLDEFRHLKDGWGDGIQHPSGWGDGYGKAPSHDALDWLADIFAREYPDDLPLPRIYPTLEGGVQMEWRLGQYDINLEVDFNDRVGEWNWVDLNSQEEGESTLNMADTDGWKWVTDELRRFSGVAN